MKLKILFFILFLNSLLYSEWEIQSIEEVSVSGPTYIALDSKDNPYIACFNSQKDELQCISYDKTHWRIDTVDNDIEKFSDEKYKDILPYLYNLNIHRYAGFCIDSHDKPHIAYTKGPECMLKYAKYNGSSWIIENVVNEKSPEIAWLWLSFDLDKNDNPFIGYCGYPQKSLKFAEKNNSLWHIQTIDQSGDVVYGITLKVDKKSCPHLVYHYNFHTAATKYKNTFSLPIHHYLNYAYWNGNLWKIFSNIDNTERSIIASPCSLNLENLINGVGEDTDSYENTTSLAVDSTGWLHIVYPDQSKKVKYIKWDGTSWSTSSICDLSGPLASPKQFSLALDSKGYPHVSYVYYNKASGNMNLKYAKWTGEKWSFQTVDATGLVGVYSSIVLDSNDYPHISYYGSGYVSYYTGYLKYAKWVPGAPVFTDDSQTNTNIIEPNNKLNIAVVDFAPRNVSVSDASIISDFLRIRLVNTNVFNVIEKENMKDILKEQNFQQSGCTDIETAVQIGKILNVRKLVFGSYGLFLEEVYHISVSIVDVETGKIVASQKVNYEQPGDAEKSIKELAERIVSQISD